MGSVPPEGQIWLQRSPSSEALIQPKFGGREGAKQTVDVVRCSCDRARNKAGRLILISFLLPPPPRRLSHLVETAAAVYCDEAMFLR